MRFWILFFVASFFSFSQVVAQDNFSEAFFNFTRNSQLQLPSNACIDNDLEGSVAYRTYAGKLSLIRSYYADLNFNLRKKEVASAGRYKHVVGIGFYNDKEGEFFTRARIVSRYAIHLPLRENLHLSGGMSFHLINYNFNASGSGASGSAWNWSAGWGATLYSPTFKLGVSINDANNPTIRPINYDFIIHRYMTFFGEKIVPVSPNFQIKGGARCNWMPGYPTYYILQLGVVLSNTVSISGFQYVSKGTGVAFDLNKIKFYKGFTDFSVAYLIPGQNVNPAVGQYELNLRFYMDK